MIQSLCCCAEEDWKDVKLEISLLQSMRIMEHLLDSRGSSDAIKRESLDKQIALC